MEKLGSDAFRDYSKPFPNQTYIEKLVDIKIAQASKSILKTSEIPNTTPKNLRFDHIVKHKQTYGRYNDEMKYEVLVNLTHLPLVDEDEGTDIITKQQIIEVGQAVENERKRVDEGAEISQEDLQALEYSEKYFRRLESLFDGSRHLPFKLPKKSDRDIFRTNRKLSAGDMTKTLEQSKVMKAANTPSWSTDPKREAALEALHDLAMSKMKGAMTTVQNLAEKMLDLRSYGLKLELTSREAYDLFIDFDRARGKFLTKEVLTELKNTSTAQERTDILSKFYRDNILPLETEGVVDNEKVKEFLEEKLDIVFEEEQFSFNARYAEITDDEIIKYLQKRYVKNS